MALFKIKKGLKANLPKSYVEGYCYFTTDDGKFYIDTTDDASGRICLNADQADKATQDSSGNIITNTYATKTALTNLVGDTPVGTQISNAIVAESAYFDTSAESTGGTTAPLDADTLGGVLPSGYVTQSELNESKIEVSENYLLKTATAVNSTKLGGVAASEYATHTDVSAAIANALNAIQNASGINF